MKSVPLENLSFNLFHNNHCYIEKSDLIVHLKIRKKTEMNNVL